MFKLTILFVFVFVLAVALLAADVNADLPAHRPPATCVPGQDFYGIGECYIMPIHIVVTSPPTVTPTKVKYDGIITLPPVTPDPVEYPPPPVLGTPAVTPVVSSWTFGPSVVLPLIVRWPDSYPAVPSKTPQPLFTPTKTPYPVGPSPTWTTTAGTVTPTKTPFPVGG